MAEIGDKVLHMLRGRPPPRRSNKRAASPHGLGGDAESQIITMRSPRIDVVSCVGLVDVGGEQSGEGIIRGVEKEFVCDLIAFGRRGFGLDVGGVEGAVLLVAVEGVSAQGAAEVAGFVFVVGFGAGPEVSAAAEDGADALVGAEIRGAAYDVVEG